MFRYAWSPPAGGSAEDEAFRGATLCLKSASRASADNEAYNEAFRGATLCLKPVGRAASVNEGVSWRDAMFEARQRSFHR